MGRLHVDLDEARVGNLACPFPGDRDLRAEAAAPACHDLARRDSDRGYGLGGGGDAAGNARDRNDGNQSGRDAFESGRASLTPVEAGRFHRWSPFVSVVCRSHSPPRKTVRGCPRSPDLAATRMTCSKRTERSPSSISCEPSQHKRARRPTTRARAVSRPAACLLASQFVAADLAGGRQRELVDELDLARHFVGGQALADEGLELDRQCLRR